MNHLKPIDLLKDRLKEYERALQKSFESYQKGMINEQLFQTHKDNLSPLIFDYAQTIQLLESWKKN